MTWIGQLYAIEKRAKHLEPHQRKDLRKDEAKPILRKLGKWLKRQRGQVLPKDPIGKASSMRCRTGGRSAHPPAGPGG